MHLSRHSCPYSPVPIAVRLMDGYPQIYEHYELHHSLTSLLKRDRYWSVCLQCDYRSRPQPYPGRAETSVRDHLYTKHRVFV